MKKTVLLMTACIMCMWSFSQSIYTKNYRGYSVVSNNQKGAIELALNIGNFEIDNVQIDGTKYSKILFGTDVSTFKKGFAELPMLSTALLLDNNNDINIIVTGGEYVDIDLTNPLIPSRGTIYRNQDPQSIPYIIAPESMVDAWYPGNLAESAEPFVFRDTRGVNIYTYPFQYNPVKNVLRVYKTISITVIEDKTSSTNPLTISASTLDPAVNEAYRALYVNYSPSKFANQIAEFGEMLVIYTSRDASVIQPYIDWKRQKGFKVHTQQVATGTNVKTNIQNAYTSNPNLLYVQLVGDWADIKSDLGTGQSAPMDPYMGCVAGSDFYPELIIGRFSASTTAQVTVQINKAINYEKTPDMAGTWYKNALGMARNEGAGSGDDSEGDDLHMQRIRDRLLTPSYNYSTVYQEYDGNSTYVSSNTTSTIISSRINTGVSVINFANHGSETGWSVGSYSSTHVNNLTNGSKLPVIFSVACVVGKFHRTTGDCFAETWLKKENGGAVATIMSTINQPWIPPMRGQDYFNDILIGGYDYTSRPGNGTSTTAVDKRTTFGSITFNGNVLMLAEQYTNTDTRETFQTWTIFGDASLQLRTNTPKAITVGAGNVTGSPYNVTVTSSGVAVPNARVALFQNGVSFTAVTNSSGVASISHNFTSGTATVTITGYNLGTYQASVSVGSSGTAPATPTGLASSNVTASSFSLSWSASSGATSYDVQIRPQGGSWTTYNTTSTSYSASGLNASTTYEAQVSAKNSHGSSAYTSPISVTTSAGGTAPATPTGLATSSITTNSATLGWTAVSGATSYDVQIRPQGGTYSTYNVTTNSYNASGLTANTTYEWSVRAKNSYGSSSYSSNVTFTTQNVSSGLTLPVSQTFASTMPSGWTTQNIGTSITERWTMSNTANAGGTAYEAKCSYQNVSPGTTRLITPAINTVGVSQVNLSFRHMFDAYSTGATLRVQTSNDKVTWTNTSWSVATTSTNIAAATVNVAITTNLNNANTYFAFVVDGNLYQIDYWYIDNVSLAAGSSATVPTVSTTAASSITSSSAVSGGNVTADGGATVTERGVCYSTSSNPTIANSKVVSGSGTGSFSANIAGLTASTTYYVRAYATNSAGTAYGSQISFTTSAVSGGLPLPVSQTFSASTMPSGWTTQNVGTSITERWSVSNTKNAGGAAYEMKCSWQNVNPGTTRLITPAINTQGVNQVTFSFRHMLDAYGTGVTLRVQTSNDKTNWTNTTWSVATTSSNIAAGTVTLTITANLNSPNTYFALVAEGNLYQIDYWYVDNVSITDASRSGEQNIEIEDTEFQFTIFPNPVNNILNIGYSNLSSSFVARVFDLQGRLIKQFVIENSQYELDVSELSNGVYLISINVNEKLYSKRFIKM